MKKQKIINSPQMGSKQSTKFWNFVGGEVPELVLYGEIAQDSWWGDEVTHTQFASDLKALGNVGEIVVRINSGGGDVFAANAIYCLLKDHEAKITVKIDGWAASAATVIAMAGDSIEIPASAIFMVHDPKTVLCGAFSKEECEAQAKSIETVKNSIVESYATKTGKSHEELSQIMSNETWYTGQEAVDAGFCDVVTTYTQDQGGTILNYAGLDPQKHKDFPARLMPLYTASANNNPQKAERPLENNITENKIQNKEEGKKMDLEELKKTHPELVAQIINAAKAEAVAEERKRIQNIEEIAMDGFEAEAHKAKFETGASPESYAMSVQRSIKEQGTAYLTNRADDAKASHINEVKPAVGNLGNQGAEVVNEATVAFHQYQAKQAKRKGL